VPCAAPPRLGVVSCVRASSCIDAESAAALSRPRLAHGFGQTINRSFGIIVDRGGTETGPVASFANLSRRGQREVLKTRSWLKARGTEGVGERRKKKRYTKSPVAFGFVFEGEGRSESAMVEWYTRQGAMPFFEPDNCLAGARLQQCTVPIEFAGRARSPVADPIAPAP